MSKLVIEGSEEDINFLKEVVERMFRHGYSWSFTPDKRKVKED